MNALILFVKEPVPGNVKTRLGHTIGMEQAAALYRSFADAAFAVAAGISGTATEVFVWYAPGANVRVVRDWIGHEEYRYEEQRGNTLGERMRHAFREAFRRGAAQAVIVGTDVPELDLALVTGAYRSLCDHDVVIGPSTDGGYYLLGMVAPGVDLFADVPWSTPGVLPATLRLIARKGATVALLPERSDIDTEEDYRHYLSRRRRWIRGTRRARHPGDAGGPGGSTHTSP